MTRLPQGYIPQSVSSLTILAMSFRTESEGTWRERISEVCGLGLAGHGARVGCMNRVIAEYMGVFDEREAVMAGQLHDIGKILVPDAILDHTGALSESQRTIINKHPDYGHMILTSVLDFPELCVVTNTALSHHERWDGTGYPNGLLENEIPLEARMTSISDVIDALASPRSYKPGWEWDQITDLLREESGRAFDPAMVAIALECIPDLIAARNAEVHRQGFILPLESMMEQPEPVATTHAVQGDMATPDVPAPVAKPIEAGCSNSQISRPSSPLRLSSFGSCEMG